MKTILVTGGAGFIGTNLIKRLINDGHNVISIDNYNTGRLSNHQDDCYYHSGDISLIRDFSEYGKFDMVYHLAAIARIQPSFTNPVEYFQTNANGTLNIVDYCSENNIPLVYAGSSSHHSGKFKNPYTFSKDVGEDIIKLYQEHFNLKCSIARFYNVYGPHHLTEGGYTTLIGGWEKLFKENKPLTIYGDGEKRRDFTHVDDIVDGLVKILENNSWGNIFEFGRGKNYSVNEIADMFGGERVYMEDKPGESRSTLCDNSLAKKLLGWNPKCDIGDYINSYLKEN
jgi:UDP-glucose 4-epimerase